MLKLGSAYGICRPEIDAHTLDIHKAREFISLRPQRRDDFVSIADLSIYTRIHLEAIKYLSQHCFDFILLGLQELDMDVAECLGMWASSPSLIFEELLELNTDNAKSLVKNNSSLTFKKLKDLSVIIANELALTENSLHFNLPFLSAEIASSLARHNDQISICSDIEPTFEAAIELSKYRGHQITIYKIKNYPSKTLIAGLSSNPEKYLTIQKHPYPGNFHYVTLNTIGLY